MLHELWLQRIAELLKNGSVVTTRGQKTKEFIDTSIQIASWENLLDVPARNLNYRFAVAEWLWMMFGRSDIRSIGQYNSILKQYSDDGVWLTGAYGPHLNAQKRRVIEKLKTDSSTRQAVIEIPRPMHSTKDEPCTLSLQFLNRDNCLHLIVTMRSSDVWLGLPYDIFSFSMIQNCFAGELKLHRGLLSLRAGSMHLYEKDFESVRTMLRVDRAASRTITSPDLPGFPPAWLDDVLLHRDPGFAPPDDGGPWHRYAQVLLADSRARAYAILRCQ